MDGKKLIGILYTIYLIGTISLSYFFINENMVHSYDKELKQDLVRVSKTIAELVDKEDVAYLVDQLGGLPENREEINSSRQFKKVQNQLLFVNKTFDNLSSWSYIYYQSEKPGTVYLVVPTADGVKYAEPYDISPYPIMMESIKDKSQTYKSNIVYDQEYKVWVMSSFSPIHIGHTYIATVGVDMFLENYDRNLSNIRISAMLLTIAVVFIGGILLPFGIYKLVNYFSSDLFDTNLRKSKLKRAIKKAKKENDR